MPEIDIPGHATALMNAIEATNSSKTNNTQSAEEERHIDDFSGTNGGTPERTFGVFPVHLDVRKQMTAETVRSIIEELADTFPGEYFHVGGDEVERFNPSYVIFYFFFVSVFRHFGSGRAHVRNNDNR